MLSSFCAPLSPQATIQVHHTSVNAEKPVLEKHLEKDRIKYCSIQLRQYFSSSTLEIINMLQIAEHKCNLESSHFEVDNTKKSNCNLHLFITIWSLDHTLKL